MKTLRGGEPMDHLGLGKTLFNSSACFIRKGCEGKRFPQIELILTERITRKKASGAWPEHAINALIENLDSNQLVISENRDVITPSELEDLLDRGFPFYEYLEKQNLSRFSRKFNPKIRFVTHHRCHARAASLMSPFHKSVILVIDGAGSDSKDFSSSEKTEESSNLPHGAHEEFSVYLFDEGRLKCIFKNWQTFKRSSNHSPHHFSEGIGTLYEKSAEFIFNSKRAAGKVMGLAAFGSPQHISSRSQYLENLDWSKAFTGKSKKEWENSNLLQFYSNIAASVQTNFEERLMNLALKIRNDFPDYSKLILTGGCALNCTANMKLVKSGIYEEIYVPPFPGDESIGLGAAAQTYFDDPNSIWEPFPHESQNGYLGSFRSMPNEKEILEIFNEEHFALARPNSISKYAAEILKKGEVIGWFQGRSETGPRALGNRSILARPDKPGIKDYLNYHIKFRESFRPYGCSVSFEKSHEYFEVSENFNNPFMSFAPKTKKEYLERLKEVTHVDGTSRMQTVRSTQNSTFYELIQEFGKLTDLFCVLNTSLNIMGEPIVESLKDARNFLLKVPVHGMAIGNFYVSKKPGNVHGIQ